MSVFNKFKSHKNNKLVYYISTISGLILPRFFYQKLLKTKLNKVNNYDLEYIKSRLNYYCKLEEIIHLVNGEYLKDFNLSKVKRQRVYFFDTYEFTKYFDDDLKICREFGDVTFIPEEASLVKSRPIKGNNANSVVLNLGKNRHFTFVNDSKSFEEKKNMLIGRNYVTMSKQAHRLNFYEKYIDHPMCDVGMINKQEGYEKFLKNKISIAEHLDYKFILCLEGNDVATNLKWVMSSNSLAFSTELVYETWFMEGTLIPDYHFVKIKDDYSDLEEKMEYYINNPSKTLEIIKNANNYIKQFQNKNREELLSLLVLEKYFYMTGQKSKSEILDKLIKFR